MNSSSAFIIRQAVPADQAAVEACIEASFSKWIPSMGMKPMALLADYEAMIAGRPQTLTGGPGAFQLFRIGDAVEARNTHAAIYDAMRLMVTL